LIEVGDVAPDFELAIGPGRVVRLADLRGGPVALAFYGADWNPLCGDQLRLYSENLDSLNTHNACLVGISVDGPWSHPAYAEALSLRFPLAADFEPKGAVAPSYGVYRDDDGVAEPALFVIDGTGRIAWNHVSPMDVNPGMEGILEALCTLKKSYSHVLAGSRYLTPPVGIGDHARGSDHASVTLVEYGDYECSHCGPPIPWSADC
jgi:peroxiredoxin